MNSGVCELTLTTTPGKDVQIFVSSDLTAWEPLATLAQPTGSAVIRDAAARTARQRFYVVVTGLPPGQ